MGKARLSLRALRDDRAALYSCVGTLGLQQQHCSPMAVLLSLPALFPLLVGLKAQPPVGLGAPWMSSLCSLTKPYCQRSSRSEVLRGRLENICLLLPALCVTMPRALHPPGGVPCCCSWWRRRWGSSAPGLSITAPTTSHVLPSSSCALLFLPSPTEVLLFCLT